MATDEELQAYVDSLPDIYREILETFPLLEPDRKVGYGLAFQSILADFAARRIDHTFGQLILACQQLEAKGLVKVVNGIFVRPTEYGERLIEILTRVKPERVTVPPLPPPPAD